MTCRSSNRSGMHDFHIHWATVVAGTAAYFVLGAIWYGLFAGPWVRALGSTREEIREDDVRWIYLVQLLSTFVLVLLSSWVLHDLFHVDAIGEGVVGGLVLGVIASLASSGDFLYESRRRSVPLYLINSGYRVLGLTVLGVIVAALGE